MADEWKDPWHEVAVTVTHFHYLAGHDSLSGAEHWCDGHPEHSETCSHGAPIDEHEDVEVERELIHPPECKDDRKACGQCQWCRRGAPAGCCDHASIWRCGTEHQIDEYGDEYDELQQSGRYRVQAWWSRDYWGEYDSGMEIGDAP